jgi:hypothetical protein
MDPWIEEKKRFDSNSRTTGAGISCGHLFENNI